MEKSAYCKGCIENQKRTGKIDECAECEFMPPELIPENRPIWRFFNQVSRYWVRDFEGRPLSLDWSTVESMARMSSYEMTLDEVRKLQVLEQVELQWINKQTASK